MQYRYYFIAVLISAVLGWVENSHGHLEACDGEWHRGGYPQWSGISFSESNYPEVEVAEPPRRKSKKRRIKQAKRPQAKRAVIVFEEIPEG